MRRALAAIALVACGGSAPEPAAPARDVAPSAPRDETSVKLEDVVRVHGDAGPWAVLGYRMSEHALEKLGAPRFGADVEVVVWTPRDRKYAALADGAHAHSGASLGRLSLSLVETTPENVLVIFRDRRAARAVALKPRAAFVERFGDASPAAGPEIMKTPGEALFEEVNVAR